MKKYLLLSFLLFAAFGLKAQSKNMAYNKALADSMGADPYGMKNYVFVILRTGKTVINDKKVSDSLFRGHLQNIGHLADEGKMVVAGPFGKNDKSYRGLFILNVKTKTEAAILLKTDPAIAAGLLEPELIEWYGSAALALYLPYHKQMQKMDFEK